MLRLKLICLTILFFSLLASLPGQDQQNIPGKVPVFVNQTQKTGEVFSFIPGDDFKIIRKYNLRIKKDNRYQGSVYREFRQLSKLIDTEKNGSKYSGKAFVFEEQKREGRLNARRVDTVTDTEFIFYDNGSIKPEKDSVFPLLRDFPVFLSNKKVIPGDKWQEYGSVFVDPLKKGLLTKVEFVCEYRYDGIKNFNGSDVYSVYAQYAVRYSQGDDPDGDFELKKLSGSHKVMIYIDDPAAGPFFIQDNIDEIYTYTDTTVSFKGFSHTWYKPVLRMDRVAVSDRIADAVAESGSRELSENITVEKRAEGVAITLNKIQFQPDQAVMLPGEEKKISIIADILKKIPERSFLVTGHTADIGTVESQVDLSVKRAETIANMLKSEGIRADRLIYQGKGGSEPVASNDTDEGRAQNRRVEIIILED